MCLNFDEIVLISTLFISILSKLNNNLTISALPDSTATCIGATLLKIINLKLNYKFKLNAISLIYCELIYLILWIKIWLKYLISIRFKGKIETRLKILFHKLYKNNSGKN